MSALESTNTFYRSNSWVLLIYIYQVKGVDFLPNGVNIAADTANGCQLEELT